MIDKEQVEHIADLARLGLGKSEKEMFQEKISAILDFVNKLKEADASGVVPMASGTELENRAREDEIEPRASREREKILANVPKKRDGYVEVKAIL